MRNRVAAMLSAFAGLSFLVQAQPAEAPLDFDVNGFTLQSAAVDGQSVQYRSYEGIVYVRRPVDATYQRMNVFVPAAYFAGTPVGGYDAKTAPIFLPNSVGGYMPARPGAPAVRADGKPNAALLALLKGYVVAWPGARGRTLQDTSGRFTGKAPAVIVDLKAAVRYLRLNDARMPGDAEKIVSNGTSAGGAVSALLGASGNHPDFEPLLTAVGAAEARDDVFAVSAYCPITDLDHADMAYERQFLGVHDVARVAGRPPVGVPGGGRPPGATPPKASQGTMTPEQVRLSGLLAPLFRGPAADRPPLTS
jgi:hypothetical protein